MKVARIPPFAGTDGRTFPVWLPHRGPLGVVFADLIPVSTHAASITATRS